MAKLPFIQFYPADWIRDTQVLSLEAQGAWLKLLCAAWDNPERGKLTWGFYEFENFFARTRPQVESLLRAISKVGEVIALNSEGESVGDWKDATQVTIISRRMVREEKKRKQGFERVKRFRNADVTEMKCPIYQKSEVRSHISEKSKRGSQYPDDFQVSEEVRAWAVKERLPDPSTELQAFRDYHTAKGSTFKDWDAALRTWMRNAKRFGGNGSKPDLPTSQVPKAPSYKPTSTERRADPEMLAKLRELRELTGQIGKV